MLFSMVPFGISISIGRFATLTLSIGAPGKIKCPVVPVSPIAWLRLGLFIILVTLFTSYISKFSFIFPVDVVLFLLHFE